MSIEKHRNTTKCSEYMYTLVFVFGLFCIYRRLTSHSIKESYHVIGASKKMYRNVLHYFLCILPEVPRCQKCKAYKSKQKIS